MNLAKTPNKLRIVFWEEITQFDKKFGNAHGYQDMEANSLLLKRKSLEEDYLQVTGWDYKNSEINRRFSDQMIGQPLKYWSIFFKWLL